MLPEDQCFWEAEYQDGTIHREIDGFNYRNIQRDSLTKFRLVYQGHTVFETSPPSWANGHNFVYRRTTALSADNRSVIFVLGWIPHGPAFAVDITNGICRVKGDGFENGDPELYMPVPMPGEDFFADYVKKRQ